MTDRYSAFASSSIGQRLIPTFGLPNPTPLRRFREGAPPLAGPAVLGSAGGPSAVLDAARRAASEAGVETLDELAPSSQRPSALVYDAGAIDRPEDLVALHGFFSPVVRNLTSCGRVVVLARPPEAAATAAGRVAQRAIEGFTRSLGKEVGRGSTVNLVRVADGAEEALASTVQFLLSARSAYVSGQVLRVTEAVDREAVDREAVDREAEDREAEDREAEDREAEDREAVDWDGAERRTEADRPLAGKVAVVTGSSRGIGAAIARVLARDGATVVGVDVPAAASDLARQARETGGSHLPLDITAVDAAPRIARHATQTHGGLDVVVHNAGITRDKRLANMKADAWSAVLAVNLVAPLRVTEHLLSTGAIRRGGRVVGVSSIAGIGGNTGQSNYATSKAGIIGLVDALSPRAAETGVTVNAVAPGFIETQMTAVVPLMLREAGRRMNSLSQGGQPVDVAETIAWLAHPGSGGVNGTVVRVCGQSLLGA